MSCLSAVLVTWKRHVGRATWGKLMHFVRSLRKANKSDPHFVLQGSKREALMNGQHDYLPQGREV